MSLFDVDKKGAGRTNPESNHKDFIIHEALMAKNTDSVNYVTDATDLSSISDAKNGRFTIVQTGSYTPTTSFASITNPGAGNFGSTLSSFYTAPHNLSFTPGVLGFIQRSDGTNLMLPYVSFLTVSATQPVWFEYQIRVDATNVYLYLNAMAYQTGVIFAPGITFSWYLLYQEST